MHLHGSSEEKKMAHKELKSFYNLTNKHLQIFGLQVLTNWTYPYTNTSISSLDSETYPDWVNPDNLFNLQIQLYYSKIHAC